MSWITVIWSMVASACLTLAAVHLLVWGRRRESRAHVLLAVAAVATTLLAALELRLLRAQTIEEFGLIVRWGHVPFWLSVLSLVGFVRVALHAGRAWLAWTVCGLRTLSLIINFSVTPNINYREITALRPVRVLGELVSTAQGVPNPWMLVGQASLLLLLVFLVDAAVTIWRRDDRWSARILISAMVFFIAASMGQFVLDFWGIRPGPLTPSLFFLGVVAAMSVTLSEDVLQSLRLSDDLRESEERMTLAAEAAGLGMWMWSIVPNQVWGSASWRRMLGFGPGENLSFEKVIGRIHPEDRGLVERAVAGAVAGRTGYAEDYRVVWPDGTVRWLAARGRVYPDEKGQPARMVGASIDITERKAAEREMEERRREVAHLSRVTTLGEISGSLAHELSQPIGAILSNAEAAQLHLASDTPDLSELRNILADIRKDDLRAGDIIHGIRDFLRRQAPDMQPLDLAGLMADAIKILAADASGRETTMTVTVEPGLPRVTGDRVHVQQVLVNLLMNGMDAMNTRPLGDRRLLLGARQLDAHRIEVTVSDVGDGIAAADLPRLFEPFHTTKRGGLGLGLSICRSIIESHGGSISVTNNPDRGATARFTLLAHQDAGR